MANHKLYNGGHRLVETLSYTVKNNAPDFKELNWNAYWRIDAPAHDFFELPDTISAPGGGNARMAVYFHEDMPRKYGHRGIILIDEERGTDPDDEQPYAKTEKEAIEKGERIWHNYLLEIVGNHFNLVQDTRAAGRAPKGASFFTRAALKELGLKDPADLILEPVVVRQESAAEKKEAEKTDSKLQKK